MRHVRTLITGASAAVITLGVVGITTTAQALPHVTVAVKTIHVPAGPATSLVAATCSGGATASFGSSTPALPLGA